MQDFRRQVLLKELELLERKIEFYDDLAFRVKGWAVVSWLAVVSYALGSNDWRIIVCSGLIPILFMIVEASYKRYQIRFIGRTRRVMKLLNDPGEWEMFCDDSAWFPVYDLLDLYGDADLKDRQWGSVWKLLFRPSVSMVYWCLLTGSLIWGLMMGL